MNVLPESYKDTLIALKNKIRQAQTKIVLTANVQLLAIYWEIGEFICHIEKQKDWGSKIIDQISADLKDDFPELKGLSPRNLRYMRNFFVNWPQLSLLRQNGIAVNNLILQQPVAKLPWGHICILNDRIKSEEERNFYAAKTAENNWSRNVLLNQIDSGLFIRQGKLLNNFTDTLPLLQGDLAKELFKDPYKFDFFHLSEEAKERDLENALIADIQKFLLELGKGFAFVGRQFKIDKGDCEYFLDLLFYHTKLHCYIVLELKTGEFKPEYAGKMNFYLSVIDEDERMTEDHPSIGIILCKSKNKITAEYALRDMNKPMGIAEYNWTNAIPNDIKGELPSIEDLENELEKAIKLNQKPYEKQLDRLKSLIQDLDQEEPQETISPRSIFRILRKIFPKIMNKVDEILKANIYPLFDAHSFEFTSSGYHFSNYNDERLATYLYERCSMVKEKGTDPINIGLVIHLKMFKKGDFGFSISQNLLFSLSYYHYEVGLKMEDYWFKYSYAQIWEQKHIDELAEKWINNIIGGINNRIGSTIDR